jgi:Tfp pilus assembly protein PilF
MRRGRTVSKTIISLVLGVWVIAPLLSHAASPRTVNVQIVVDAEIPNLVQWNFKARGPLNGCARLFEKEFGLRLVFRDPVRWYPKVGPGSLVRALGDLKKRAPADGTDIVAGILSPKRILSPGVGISDYTQNILLICDAPGQVMEYALRHELCHLFGAIDLAEKGSLMSAVSPGLRIDDFTARAVRLHRDRTFERGRFPLAPGDLDAAVSLYLERSEGKAQEPQADIFLTLLYLEKGDPDAASWALNRAACGDPGRPGLHVLRGDVRLAQKQAGQAIEEYRQALGEQPAECSIHLKLALAHAQQADLRAAAGECRAAIAIEPRYERARLVLARLELALDDPRAAGAECRSVLGDGSRSAEALCLLGASLIAQGRQGLGDSEASASPRPPGAEAALGEAVSVLQQAAGLDPTSAEIHLYLGLAFLLSDRASQAEFELLRALDIEPDNLEILFNLGNLSFKAGDTSKAAFYLKRIIEIDPRSDIGSHIVSRAFRSQRTRNLGKIGSAS